MKLIFIMIGVAAGFVILGITKGQKAAPLIIGAICIVALYAIPEIISNRRRGNKK